MGSLPRPLSGLRRALSGLISCSRPVDMEVTIGCLLLTTPGGAFQMAAWLIWPLNVLDFFIWLGWPALPYPPALEASKGDLWRMNWTSLEYSPHLAKTCKKSHDQQVNLSPLSYLYIII